MNCPEEGGAACIELPEAIPSTKTRRADARRVWVVFPAYRKRYLASR